MTAAARKAELDAESREVLDEIVADRRAEREQLAAVARARVAAERAEQERRKLHEQRAADAMAGYFDAISDAQVAMTDLSEALGRAKKFRTQAAEARAQLGQPMPGLSDRAVLTRWSSYIAERLAGVSNNVAHFGSLKLFHSGRRHGDWQAAERAALGMKQEEVAS